MSLDVNRGCSEDCPTSVENNSKLDFWIAAWIRCERCVCSCRNCWNAFHCSFREGCFWRQNLPKQTKGLEIDTPRFGALTSYMRKGIYKCEQNILCHRFGVLLPYRYLSKSRCPVEASRPAQRAGEAAGAGITGLKHVSYSGDGRGSQGE